jgi:hypothetical protein
LFLNGTEGAAKRKNERPRERRREAQAPRPFKEDSHVLVCLIPLLHKSPKFYAKPTCAKFQLPELVRLLRLASSFGNNGQMLSQGLAQPQAVTLFYGLFHAGAQLR